MSARLGKQCRRPSERTPSAVVPARLLPRHCQSIRFRRIEPEQVRELMDAAGRLRPKRSVRPPCIRFLIGLLYTTGMRIGEALQLNLEDIDPFSCLMSRFLNSHLPGERGPSPNTKEWLGPGLHDSATARLALGHGESRTLVRAGHAVARHPAKAKVVSGDRGGGHAARALPRGP